MPDPYAAAVAALRQQQQAMSERRAREIVQPIVAAVLEEAAAEVTRLACDEDFDAEAMAAFRRSRAGVRGQIVTPQDCIEYWIHVCLSKRLRALAAKEND